MKLDYNPDKNQQTIILKKNMDNNTTEQAQCQVEDGQTRGKVEGVCRLKTCFHRAAARINWKMRVTMLNYGKFSWDVL